MKCLFNYLKCIIAFLFCDYYCLQEGYLLALLGLWGNKMLLLSFLTAMLVSAWLLLTFDRNIEKLTLSWGSVTRITLTGILAVIFKASISFNGQDVSKILIAACK